MAHYLGPPPGTCQLSGGLSAASTRCARSDSTRGLSWQGIREVQNAYRLHFDLSSANQDNVVGQGGVPRNAIFGIKTGIAGSRVFAALCAWTRHLP